MDSVWSRRIERRGFQFGTETTITDSSPSQRKDETSSQSSTLGAHTSSETSSSPRFREQDMRSRRSQWGFSSQPDSQPSLPNSKLPLDSPFASLLRDPDRIPSSQPASRFSSPLTDPTSGPESYVSPFIKQFRDPRLASRTTLVDSPISQRRDEDGGQKSTFGHPSFEGSSSSPFGDCDLFSRRRQRGFNSQLDSQPSLVSLLSSSFGNLDGTVLRSQRGDEMKPEAPVGDQNRILRSQTARFSPSLRDQRTNTASEPQNPTSRLNMGCSIDLRSFGPDSQTSSFSSSVTGDPDVIPLRYQCGDKIQNEASTFLSRRRDQYRFQSSEPTNILSSRTNVTSGAESHISPFSRHYCSPDSKTTPTTPFLSRSKGRDEIGSSQLVGSATPTERDRFQDPLRSPSMEPAISKRGGLDDVRPIRTPLQRGNRAGLSSSRPADPSPSLCIERKGHAERYEHSVQQPAGVSHPPGSRWTGEPELHHGPLPLEINKLIWSYAKGCPINLFDTLRGRNISRSELKHDISLALKDWMKVPVTSSELVATLLAARPLDSGAAVWTEEIHPYVTTAMAKTPFTESVDRFISTLTNELKAYMMRLVPFAGIFFQSSGTHPSVARALEAVRALIERKGMHSSKPSLSEVKEQIEHFGLYAILSHRWDEGHELSFADVENFHKTTVQAKKGFKKLTGFSNAVSSHYGGRYLWMDTVCISEKKRKKSIPLMFGWYRHAYVCIVYLTTKPEGDNLNDPWFTRGWTLQELLAARRINIFTSDTSGVWSPHYQDMFGISKFSASRCSNRTYSVFDKFCDFSHLNSFCNWYQYQPGLKSTLLLFEEMIGRETKIPEDRVYCILSASNVDIPIDYDEGFDSAFYRLQVYYITKAHDRRCFLWLDTPNRSFRRPINSTEVAAGKRVLLRNSMLATDFQAYAGIHQYNAYVPTESLPDPSISFDEDGVMRIMVSLFSWKDLRYCPSQRSSMSEAPEGSDLVFASLHFLWEECYYCVLLRRVTSTKPRATVRDSTNISQEPKGHDKVVYERVSLRLLSKSELPSHAFVKPEWVYIR